jgi:CO/xanthine dehydrogenase Mo-binding subunit
VLATHAHARIVAIDASAALEMPGVIAVLAAADLPIKATAWDRVGMPLARAEVVFAGQPIALVIAESEAGARDAAELVDAQLEPLAVVLDEVQLAGRRPLGGPAFLRGQRDLLGAQVGRPGAVAAAR